MRRTSMSRLRTRFLALPHRLMSAISAGVLLVATATLSLSEVRADEHDAAFRQQLAESGIGPLTPTAKADPNVFELGKSLFFDRELSGNRDTSCASCHHPSLSSGDSRSLPSGVGGEGLGPDRTHGAGREIVPRNSPEIFQRGDSMWTSMFWDSRVSEVNGQFTSPAGPDLPPDLDSVLAIQAMFPVTSRAEMRGNAGDLDVHGAVNEIAHVADADLPGIWQALMDRLLAIPEYQQAFANSFPEVPTGQLGFEHAATAIAAFEREAFTAEDTAWDRYLGGDDNAITESAKRGARHFHGGNCAACHSGNLMTDQQHHNVGAPQLGPGKDPETGLDPGRALETGDTADEFAFRTPPLRNVVLTGPWMHNGAFTSLEDVIRQKFDPVGAMVNYDVTQLDEMLQATVRLDDETIAAVTENLDPLLPIGEELTDDQVDDLMAFLFSLTSPSVDRLSQLVPASVPSGLEVDELPPSEMQVTYNPEDGQLTLDGPDEWSLDALFLRINDDENGAMAEFEFNQGAADWADDLEIVLSDEADAQSFIDYRTEPLFLLANGDTLDSLLPAGLTDTSIDSHLTAAYRIQGSPVLWNADVVTVPEPSSLAMLVLGLICLAVAGTRRVPSA